MQPSEHAFWFGPSVRPVMLAGLPMAADVIDDLIDDLERRSAATPLFPDDTFMDAHRLDAEFLPTQFIRDRSERGGPAIHPRGLFIEICYLADRGHFDDALNAAWRLYRSMVANCEDYREALAGA